MRQSRHFPVSAPLTTSKGQRYVARELYPHIQATADHQTTALQPATTAA